MATRRNFTNVDSGPHGAMAAKRAALWPRALVAALSFFAPTAIFGIALPAGAEEAAHEANQCVACHSVEHLPISLGHSISDWRGSAHGRAGVGCEKCHGGNASATDAEKAHVGVLPSSDVTSLVNMHNLASTCGSCHKDEYAAYKGTDHAKKISTDDDAATCVTCHGSMATSLPSPNELKARCTVCHDKPIEARAALVWLAAAKMQLLRTQHSIEATRTAAPDWHKDALVRFHEMEQSYAKIVLKWHTFDMEASLHQGRDLLQLGKLLDEEARLKLKFSKDAKN